MKFGSILLFGAIASAALSLAATPARAETCTPLPVVDGRGTQVSKTVSPPGTFLTDNNWNTDFVVPQGSYYSRYVAEVTPKGAGDFSMKMFLKYRNDTADRVYDRSAVTLDRSETAYLDGTARQGSQPYQVNLLIGGIEATGESYSATVLGCR